MFTRLLFIFLFLTAFSFTSLGTSKHKNSTVENEIYPQGNIFPLALYSINDQFKFAANQGWNVAHTYVPPPTKVSYVEKAYSAGLKSMGRLSVTRDEKKQFFAKEESVVKKDIETLSALKGVAWWDLPEEQRWWIKSEMDVLKSYSSWTRKYDSNLKPNFMYIPGHYLEKDVAKYIEYIDIVPASCYSNYMKKPASYLRWSIERTFSAIAKEGYKIGNDYLNKEKTVMAILELYDAGQATMSAEQSYHDFWLALACDVKGILLYSYAYSNRSENLMTCWDIFNKAANRFTGKEQLNRVAIEGENLTNIDFNIVKGPARVPMFIAYRTEEVDYPSLKVLAKKWKDHIYVIAVNSNTSEIEAEITGFSTAKNVSTEVLFEKRNLKVSSGTIKDKFKGYGVHIYKIPL